MATKFREITKKAEDLIEQGHDADEAVNASQSRVSIANAQVRAAQNALSSAMETDEEGNPRGDVHSAQMQLRMAQGQLSAGQRALTAAQERVGIVTNEKNRHIQPIEQHNRVGQENLRKVETLRGYAYGPEMAPLAADIVERLNLAEEAKVRLLESMGVSATADLHTIPELGVSDSYTGRGGNFSTLELNGKLSGANGIAGGSEGAVSGWSGLGDMRQDGAADVQGMYSSALNLQDSLVDAGFASLFDEQQNQIADLRSQYTRDNEVHIKTIATTVNRILTTNVLSTQQKIVELNMFRSQLMNVSQIYTSQIEADAIREQDKVLQLSPLEKRQRGERYIDSILEVYRDNLLDRGTVSIAAIDSTLSELRSFYSTELDKDLLGQPNGLYSDPNYDKLIDRISNRRPPITDVAPGDSMSFEVADSGHVNPNYGRDTGYSINCQACVVVFEARERGYNLQVLPYAKGSALEKLSHDPRMAWIDPKTGKHSEYIYDNTLRSPEKYVEFINDTVKPGNRYTIQFAWKGRGHSGHIVNLDRTPDGLLRIKDNQRGLGEKSEWIGDYEVLNYLSRMKYEKKSFFGGTAPCVPKLLRIDNMDFDFSVVNRIMKGAENGTLKN